MIDALSFTLGATLGNATLALGWLLTRWRQRWLRQRRDARELMQSVRQGTDLEEISRQEAPGRTNTTPPAVGIPPIHWSDICRNCHHERREHDNLIAGPCYQVTGWDHTICPPKPKVCTCTAFEATR